MVRISKGILIGLWIVCFIYACGLNITGSDSWKCEVTLTIGAQDSVNKRIGRGTGAGKTHQEALNAAYRIVCSQLSLSNPICDNDVNQVNVSHQETGDGPKIVQPNNR